MKKRNKDLTHLNLHNSARCVTTKKFKMNLDQRDRFKILWAPFNATQTLILINYLCLRKATEKTTGFTKRKSSLRESGPEAAKNYPKERRNYLRQVFRSEKEMFPV